MKTKLFSIIATLIITVTFAQQKLIAIKGTITNTTATTLSEAITLAQPNDKIYLPGGNFDYVGTIDKTIHIIGTGFQDGQNVMGRTTINGNLALNNQADGSVFEGFYLTGYFVPTTVLTNNTFKRINMLGTSVNIYCNFNNCNFINCVAREGLLLGWDNSGTYGINNVITNSIIGRLYRAQYSTIKNSIVNYLEQCDNVVVKNNVFGKTDDCNLLYNSGNITLSHNYIVSSCASTAIAGAISNTNVISFNTISDVFLYATDFQFNPTFNFMLANPLNVGDDGTPIGIFGGQYPWKIGSLPINPNIQENNSYLDVQAQQFKLRVKVVPQTH